MTKIKGKIKWFNAKKGYGFIEEKMVKKIVSSMQVRLETRTSVFKRGALNLKFQISGRGPPAVNLTLLK